MEGERKEIFVLGIGNFGEIDLMGHVKCERVNK